MTKDKSITATIMTVQELAMHIIIMVYYHFKAASPVCKPEKFSEHRIRLYIKKKKGNCKKEKKMYVYIGTCVQCVNVFSYFIGHKISSYIHS